MHGSSRSSASSGNSFVRPRPDPQAVGASWLWAGHAMHALGRAEGGLSYHPNGRFGVGASAARSSRGASPAVLVPQLEGTRLDHENVSRGRDSRLLLVVCLVMLGVGVRGALRPRAQLN